MTTDSDCRSWFSAADLLTQDANAPVALLGAPMGLGSITPGRCDEAPAVVRAAMKRMSVYDLETETDLSALRVFDAGDVDITKLQPAESLAPIVEKLTPLTQQHELTIVLGGNNAITRPCAHALDPKLQRVGVLTLDAHFDLRDTDCGLTNGNPIQALLQDGLPGAHIAQIGLLPFANTKKAHQKAKDAGIYVATAAACKAQGLAAIAANALERLAARCDVIHVDFDIDVVDTTGCGDAFDAGMIAALHHGMDTETALRFAQATAGLVATGLGSDAGLTSFEQTLDAMKSWKVKS